MSFLSSKLIPPLKNRFPQITNPRKIPIQILPKPMSWSCSKCTFINPIAQKSTCQICLSSKDSENPFSEKESREAKWACKVCTFFNFYEKPKCEICGTRASAGLGTCFEVEDSDGGLGEGVGSVFLPLQRCENAKKVGDNGDSVVEGKNGVLGDNFVDLSEEKVGDGEEKNGFCGKRKNTVDAFLAVKKKNKVEKDEVVDDFLDLGGRRGVKKNKSVSVHGEAPSVKSLAPLKNKSPVEVAEDLVDLSGYRGSEAVNKAVMGSGEAHSGKDSTTLKIMTYNVWFNEELELRNRMKAIGDLIRLHSPDVICFQEVTPNIYGLFQQSNWWKSYKCSLPEEKAIRRAYFCMQLSKLPVKSFKIKPFYYSAMGRELTVAEVEVQENMSLVVATSHLESPCPGPPTWDQMFSKERVDQAKEAVNFLKENPNVIFCGDMNWDDKLDGEFPVTEGWVDAWSKLRPSEDGWTYDTKANPMLTGNRKLQKRLDRFLCSLRDFKVDEVEMIGKQAIAELSFVKQKKGKTFELPVLASDHFGLILTIRSK